MYSVRHVCVCWPLSYEFTSCHVFEYFIFSFVVKFMINLQFSVCCNILEYHGQVHNNLLFSVYIVIYLSPYLNLLIMFIVVFLYEWFLFQERYSMLKNYYYLCFVCKKCFQRSTLFFSCKILSILLSAKKRWCHSENWVKVVHNYVTIWGQMSYNKVIPKRVFIQRFKFLTFKIDIIFRHNALLHLLSIHIIPYFLQISSNLISPLLSYVESVFALIFYTYLP